MGSYTADGHRSTRRTPIIEQNDANNSFTAAIAARRGPGARPRPAGRRRLPSNPSNPAAGAAVSFTVTVNNRGTTASGVTTVTRLVVGTTTLNTNTAVDRGRGDHRP